MNFLHKYNQIFQQINVQLIREIPYFSGQTSYDIAKQNCLIRQRYSGSLGNLNSLINLTKILSENNINYYIDEFIEDSPVGNIRFRNLIVDFNFTESSKYIIIGAHHDSKFLPKMPFFEGANDGASGVGLILGLIGSIVPVIVTIYAYSILYDKTGGILFSHFIKSRNTLKRFCFSSYIRRNSFHFIS